MNVDTVLTTPAERFAGVSSTAGTSAPKAIDLAAIWDVIRRRLIAILAAFAIVAGMTVIAYALAQPLYTANARVAVDRQVTELVTVGRPAAPPVADSGTVDTEVQVLQSPEVAGFAVDKLNLGQQLGFGLPINGKPLPAAAARVKAIEVVRHNLQVQREGTSYAIMVSYSNANPQLAADIVNAVIDGYVGSSRAARTRDRSQEISQLRERLVQLRANVIGAESAGARYRAQTNLVDINKNGSSAEQALSVLNTQLSSARADEAAAAARAADAAKGTLGSGTLDSPTLRELQRQKADVLTQVRDLSGRYGAGHPQLQAAQRRLDVNDQLIAQETARIRSGLNAEADVARKRASSVQGSINHLQGALLAGNNASVRLNELDRNAESARGLYQAFLDRYGQSLAAQGTERSNAYVIARAMLPRAPDSPSFTAYMIGGVLAGVLAATLVALALELFERGFRSRKELEQTIGIRVLAAMPDLKTVKKNGFRSGNPLTVADHMLENETSLLAESVRSIRTALHLSPGSQSIRSLAIASSLPGEGKTTLAICLARATARAGMRVLLVDCDVRRRTTSRNMTTRPEAGLVDVLRGEAQLEQALVRDSASGAYLLPQRRTKSNELDLIGSAAMSELLDLLTARFDLVILDNAPVIAVAEARAIAAMADLTIMTVRWRTTPIHVVQMAVQELGRAGANLVGLVLSQVDVGARANSSSDLYLYRTYEKIA